ncbi:MAG TPA: cation:proton antiporter [Nitrospinota bacterium]|jgi:CPA2 family monovalent cation:H+ antiporter-2|nr:cation:proton antiporter [Nitrospinota bacterium]|tara:strand:- start:497 stop:2161 length:1665 start_codon:yes stop_codon:yes gene_type:complete
MNNLIGIIICAMAISTAINIYLKKHHVPPIIGYILSGAIITQIFGLNSEKNDVLHQVAEFGIAFLMFTVALEFSVSHLKTMRREVLLHGGIQVVLSMAIFSALAQYLFKVEIKTALIVGAALALSSTAIVLKIFNERGETSRSYGIQSLGILLFQDLAVIPLLLMVSLLSNTDQSLGLLLLKTLLSAVITLLILFFLGKYIIDYFLARVTDAHSHEIFISSILLIVISSSMLAHIFGFSYSLGAFFAGLLIAETHYKYQIEADLIPFRDILLGVFFVTVGMQIEPTFLMKNIHVVLLIMISVMIIKFLIIFSIILFSSDRITALKTGLALSQVGEFSFAIFELARTNGLIGHDLTQTMVVTVIFSMIITPFILNNLARMVSFIKIAPAEEDLPLNPVKVDENHIIICGYSHLGKTIVNKLKASRLPYVAIENHRKQVEMGQKKGDNVILGNAAQRSILEKANVKKAIAVIIAVEDEKRIRLICESIVAFAKNANIVVKVSDKQTFAKLDNLPIQNLVDQHDELAKIMVNKALACKLDYNQNHADPQNTNYKLGE